MSNYIEIATAEELHVFLHETVTFHDSLIKEVQMINRGYVMEDKSMNMGLQFDTRILVQSQWEPIAFELLCIDTKKLLAIGPEEYMGSRGEIIDSPERLIKISLDGEFAVECKKLFYKLTLEAFGNYEHLGSQVPSDDMVQAELLNNNWWQCGGCSEAWQVDVGRKYSTCPKCNRVAELCST